MFLRTLWTSFNNLCTRVCSYHVHSKAMPLWYLKISFWDGTLWLADEKTMWTNHFMPYRPVGFPKEILRKWIVFASDLSFSLSDSVPVPALQVLCLFSLKTICISLTVFRPDITLGEITCQYLDVIYKLWNNFKLTPHVSNSLYSMFGCVLVYRFTKELMSHHRSELLIKIPCYCFYSFEYIIYITYYYIYSSLGSLVF